MSSTFTYGRGKIKNDMTEVVPMYFCETHRQQFVSQRGMDIHMHSRSHRPFESIAVKVKRALERDGVLVN